MLKKLVKNGHVVLKICMWTDIQTHVQTDMLIILRSPVEGAVINQSTTQNEMDYTLHADSWKTIRN